MTYDIRRLTYDEHLFACHGHAPRVSAVEELRQRAAKELQLRRAWELRFGAARELRRCDWKELRLEI